MLRTKVNNNIYSADIWLTNVNNNTYSADMSRDKGKHIHFQLPCHETFKKVGWILTGTSMGLVV